MFENLFEGRTITLIGDGFQALSSDIKSLNGDIVGAGKDVGLENGEAAGRDGAGDAGEKVIPVPGDDGDFRMALVGKMFPVDDRLERGVVVGELVLEKTCTMLMCSRIKSSDMLSK